MSARIPAHLLCTAYEPEQLLVAQGPFALFLGRSNAGKSTLLNCLMQKELAKTSRHPGKTQSINYFKWGEKLILVDVPGYGYARVKGEQQKKWQPLMQAFFDHLPKRCVAFLLMDSYRDIETEEFDLISSLLPRVFHLQVLLTKSDRLTQSDRVLRSNVMEKSLQNVGFSLTWRFISSKTGEGISELRRWLYRYADELKTHGQTNSARLAKHNLKTGFQSE